LLFPVIKAESAAKPRHAFLGFFLTVAAGLLSAPKEGVRRHKVTKRHGSIMMIEPCPLWSRCRDVVPRHP
jgi:hypothetical protein